MDTLIKDIFENLLLIVTVLVATGASYIIKRNIDLSKFRDKKELVEIGVRFVEQAFKDYGGEQKYEEAIKWITTELNKKGLKYTDVELKGLIEKSVLEFKNALSK
ncbi:phage holin [Brevibacillus brevis]|uniref:phage holin n=1 Tax=Brevibacillus brevis TaxID=1393 RepID=UPI0007D8BC12|nr:phage holin [Brevibacillus brevis]